MLQTLPGHWPEAILPGRLPTGAGPTPVLVRHGRVFDVTRFVPTTSDFAALWAAGTHRSPVAAAAGGRLTWQR